jgi:NAD(P)-dependent dehydrogenase (short-subunit alcohol dehydrogenase family)
MDKLKSKNDFNIQTKINIVNDFFGLENKKIIVTGSSGQLGSKLVDAFLRFGSIVVGIDKKKRKNFCHDNFYFFNSDISLPLENKKIFRKIFLKYNNIDCLVNNVGVAVFSSYKKRTEKELDYVFDVNIKSYFYSIQNFDKYSKNQNILRNIINISSIYSIISPDPKIYSKKSDRKSSEIYGITKAGVNQLTRYFAVHLAKKNIRVNSISPGGIFNEKNPQNKSFVKNYSKKNPMNRMAFADEIVGGVIYLASKSSSYTNGHNLIIDGGMSCW